MDNTLEPFYKVYDLNEAAAILSLGIELYATEPDAYGRVNFVFINSEELQSIVKGYWACTLKVTARYYSDATKMLKNIIYSDRR